MEHSARPIGVIFLEGCYCERLLNPPGAKDDLAEKIVSNAYIAQKTEVITAAAAVIRGRRQSLIQKWAKSRTTGW